jgi:hypothetical protein
MALFGERRKCGCGVWFNSDNKEPYLCAQCAVTLERYILLGEPLPNLSYEDKRMLKSFRIDPEH